MGMALKIVKNRQDAEEIVSESFVRAWKCIDQFVPNYKFSTWLGRIAINTSLDFLKREGKVYLENVEEINPLAQRSCEPDYNLDNEELMSRIMKSLDSINHDFATCVRLAFLEERSYSEIAEILDVSEGTVKSRIFRARDYLSAGLAEFRG